MRTKETRKAARQRDIVQGRITDGKLIGDILRDLKLDISAKVKGFCKNVENILAETFLHIQEDAKLIMPDGPGDRVKAEEQFKKQLSAEVKQFNAEHQEIRQRSVGF